MKTETLKRCFVYLHLFILLLAFSRMLYLENLGSFSIILEIIFIICLICLRHKIYDRFSIQNHMIILYMLELVLLISLFGLLSRYLHPIETYGFFPLFIPTLIISILSSLLMKDLGKKIIKDKENLLEQYLSHYYFLKMKRELTQDILLTKKEYFLRIQKRNRFCKKCFPLIVILQILFFVMFMFSFQFSVIYFIVIGYVIYAFYQFYRYGLIKNMIDEVCQSQLL